MGANPLLEFFERDDHRSIDKWLHYFDIYHRHFAVYRGTSPTVVEFGVLHGGSLQMWREYFGPGCRVVGIDIDPRCRAVEDDGIEVRIGDQSDREFLRRLAVDLGPVEILIDDGGHKMHQQITTFEEMYSSVTAPGIYLVEDLHTSYWKHYGGGLRRRGSFIEYSKRLVDHLHAWHLEGSARRKIPVDEFTRSIHGMSFYDSVLVIEKRPVEPPEAGQTGHASF